MSDRNTEDWELDGDELPSCVSDDDELLPQLMAASAVTMQTSEACALTSDLGCVLPLPRPVSTTFFQIGASPVPAAQQQSKLDETAATTVAVAAGENATSEEHAASDSDVPTSDRIGAYFGYNGSDAMVPKPAYDAVLQRVRTLENALGTANRELRTATSSIGDLKSQIHVLHHQVAQKEALLAQMSTLEAALIARERDLDAREEVLDQMARQQRRIRKKGQGSDTPESSITHLDNLGDVAQHPNYAMASRSRRIGVDRREEEAYASWVGEATRRPSMEAIQRDAARHNGGAGRAIVGPTGITLPRLTGQRDALPPRSQTSVGVLI